MAVVGVAVIEHGRGALVGGEDEAMALGRGVAPQCQSAGDDDLGSARGGRGDRAVLGETARTVDRGGGPAGLVGEAMGTECDSTPFTDRALTGRTLCERVGADRSARQCLLWGGRDGRDDVVGVAGRHRRHPDSVVPVVSSCTSVPVRPQI